jgi:hypothetical protein
MNGSHEANDCRVPWDKIKDDRGKNSKSVEGKAHVHYVVSYCNIGVTEDLFNTSFYFWRDEWLLDTGTTSHMKFRRHLFK